MSGALKITISSELRRRSEIAYIENYNNGTQALVMYDQEGNSEVLELGIAIGAAQVGGRITGYLEEQ